MNLSKMNVYDESAADTAYLPAINDWQFELCSEHAINAAFRGTRIDESCDLSNPRRLYLDWKILRIEARIETYIDKNRRPEHCQHISARGLWGVVKPASCSSH